MAKLKYQEIKDWLQEEARKPESSVRMPTVRDIMRRFSVSLAPVNRALQELEQDGLIRRRQGAGITACGGNGQTTVRHSLEATEGTVIFAYPVYHSELLWRMTHTFEQSAQQQKLQLRHYTVNRGESFDDLVDSAAACERLRGMIIATGSDRLSQETLSRLAAFKIPVAIIDSLFLYDLPPNVFSLSPDMYKRGIATVDYLVAMGHRRIGVIRNEPLDDCFELYKKGVRKQLKHHGIPIRNDYFFATTIKGWENSADAAQSVTRDKLDFIRREKITALAYYSTAGAFAATQLLTESGIKVPEDISVIGGADYWYAGYATPALTVVTCDYFRMMLDTFAVIMGNAVGLPQLNEYGAQLIERKSVTNLNKVQP